MSFLANPKVRALLGATPVDIVFKPKKGFFSFGQGEYEVQYKGQRWGTLENDESLVEFCKSLFNGAYTSGASSGMSQASARNGKTSTTPGYDPYEVQIYKGKDPDYNYTIYYDDTPLRNVGNISTQGMNNIIDACNQLHATAFKSGVELIQNLISEQQLNNDGPSM